MSTDRKHKITGILKSRINQRAHREGMLAAETYRARLQALVQARMAAGDSLAALLVYADSVNLNLKGQNHVVD